MKRLLLLGGLALALLVGVLAYVVYSRLDRIVEAALERYGSEITQTRVRVDGAHISPASGEGALRGLTIGNPEGFDADPVLRLGEIKLSLDVASLGGGPILIREIAIDRPAITYELGPGGSNLDAIQRNVEQYAAAMTRSARESSAEGGTRLVIEHFRVRGGQVTVSAKALQGRSLTAALPDLHLRDIGKAQGGATPGEVARQIAARLSRSVTQSVATLELERALGAGREELGGAAEALRKGAGDAASGLKRLLEPR